MERETRHYYDFSLLFITLTLVGFGFVMIYSSSSYEGMTQHNSEFFFLRNHAIAAGIGVIIMLIFSKLDYRLIIKKIGKLPIRFVDIAYFGAIALQLYATFFGEEHLGARRWISIPGIGEFQPAEISKAAVILFAAYMVYQAPRRLDRMGGFLHVCLYMTPMILLIAKENLSTAIIVICVFATICFVASRKKLYYIFFVVLVALGIFLYIKYGDAFRSDRIEAWLDPENSSAGYQTMQGLYAIANGGLLGTGLGNSMQKLGAVPEAQNDMIFAIICEELGIIGAIAVMVLFLLLLWRILIIAINAPDLYGSLICVGVMTQIAVQVAFNIAVVTNTMPTTGVSLPFISCGGSAVLLLLMEIGGVLSVSNRINYEKK